MREKLFNSLAEHYRQRGKTCNFVKIYRLGPRKRDSCERAFMELEGRPFSLEAALLFFKAQQMAQENERIPSVDLSVPKNFENEQVPKEIDGKGHYLWKQDLLARKEPMVTDAEYRLRAKHVSGAYSMKLFENQEKSRMGQLLVEHIKRHQQTAARARNSPSNYLNDLLAKISKTAI